MPGPRTPRRRLGRRVRLTVVVSCLLVAGTAVGCAGSADAGRSLAVPVTASGSSSPAAGTQGVVAADEVAYLLRARADAVATGDERAFAATVADASSPSGRRQLVSFAAARALRVSRVEVGDPVLQTATLGPGRARVEVDLTYRVDTLDRGDRVARLEYALVDSGAGWRVEAEQPAGSGASAPWVAMPTLRVHRGAAAVVAGTVPAARLAEYARVAGRALPELRRHWRTTPARVLVLAPSTPAEADALLGRTGGSGPTVAATTEGPTGPAGTSTGDRVVLDPAAFARLTRSGRDVVLTHELVHVAVRATVPGRSAGWLTEGYADHVGYRRADVPTARLLAPLVAAVRTGRGPQQLPSPADLQPAGGDPEVPYLAAWQAVELVAHDHGEAALRRLVVAASSTGSDADAETATDRALRTVLGTSRAALTVAWRQRLADLAAAG